MSELRTAKAGDLTAFPGSVFVVDDTPPIAQCQEAQINEAGGSITTGQPTLTKVGAFVGIDLTGKEMSTNLPGPQGGPMQILSNTDDVVTTDYTFITTEGGVGFLINDVGQAYLTRNESSFQRFTENEGKAHTTKGGQLFVDVAAGPMAGACSDTFDPQ